MFLRSTLVFAAALLPFAACGGSGSTKTSSSSPIQVTMDTAAGNPATVSVQVVGAALERADGSRTDNLLAAPLQWTLCDPSAAPSGMTLQNAPGGSYTGLVLVVVPGSGAAQYPDGRMLPTDFPSAEVRAGFETPITHGANHSTGRNGWAPATWIAVRHASPVVLTDLGPRRGYTPQLVGSVATEHLLAGVSVVVTATSGETIFGMVDGESDQPVQLECEPAAELFDEEGNEVTRARFLAACSVEAEISITGTVDPFDIVRVRRGRHASHTHNPRLIGRIVELLPAETSFTFDVQALARRHGRVTLATPERVTVRAVDARISFSHTCRSLEFADLHVGDLGKVTWTSRTGDVVTAGEIEITSRAGMPVNPQFAGSVLEVNATENLIVMGPRHDDPIIVSGIPVTRLQVHVLPTTEIVRRQSHHWRRAPITILDIGVGDRIWVRGTVTSPASTPPVGTFPAGTILASVDADWIRVRADDDD